MPKRNRKVMKSYFVLPDEVLQLYRNREISALDLRIYAYLCNLRREYNGVQVSQKRIAFICGVTAKTVSKSVERLHKSGLIQDIIIETQKCKIKYKTAIYRLKSLPSSGYFFCQRQVFSCRISHKEFAVYLFMCDAQSHEYGKSWNSYNEICERLGFGKWGRSEVVKLIGRLVEIGLLTKTVHRVKKVFVDNIYRVVGFAALFKKAPTNEKHPVMSRVQFTKTTLRKEFTSLVTIPHFRENVKPKFAQMSVFAHFF